MVVWLSPHHTTYFNIQFLKEDLKLWLRWEMVVVVEI